MQDTAPAAPEAIESPAAPSPQETPAAPEAPAEPKVEAAGDKPRTRREALEAALNKVSEEPKAETSEGPARGPDGKFLPKDATAAPTAPLEAPKAPEAKPDSQEAKTPLSDPPTRFSADAKAAWKDAPEPVKGEIKRAITELETGLKRYQQVVEPLKPYVEMAQKQGTTVHEALGNYVRMEQMLRQNPAQGLRALAQNMGITPADVASMLTGQAAPQGNDKDREIIALRNEIQGLKQQFGQVSQTVQQTRTQAIEQSVQDFAAKNPRFDELADEIARMLQTGYASDLQDAYAKADRLNPAPQPPAFVPPPTPQTRPALSVTGAPSSGSNPANRQPSATRREALMRAMGAAGLS
jgi:hypothetical protein